MILRTIEFTIKPIIGWVAIPEEPRHSAFLGRPRTTNQKRWRR